MIWAAKPCSKKRPPQTKPSAVHRFSCRLVSGSLGRTCSVDAAEIRRTRRRRAGFTLIELQNGAKPVAMLTGLPEQHYLLSSSGGYGFIAKLGDMVGRESGQSGDDRRQRGKPFCCLLPSYASSFINSWLQNHCRHQSNCAFAFYRRIRKLWRNIARELQVHRIKRLLNRWRYRRFSAGKSRLKAQRGAAHKDRASPSPAWGKTRQKGKLLPISGSLKQLSFPK